MAIKHLHTLLHHVCRTISPPRSTAATDAQLLDQFVRHKDETAFELLVWRHGSLVLSVCHRVLQDPHAAEDAFQATFLTLVRKAGSISKRGSLSSWLYKVAYRISLRARARASRHAACEQPLSTAPAVEHGSEPVDQAASRELRQVLDVEVDRLPEKYRAPFVLCYLEGKTNEQAAEELGCPKGTVLSRLARARERLRSRLAQRGLALSALPLAALLADHADALARMTPVLVNGTVHLGLLSTMGKLLAGEAGAPVVQLMQGAAEELGTGRRRSVLLAVAAFLLLAAGVSLWAYQGWAADPLRSLRPKASAQDPAAGGNCHEPVGQGP